MKSLKVFFFILDATIKYFIYDCIIKFERWSGMENKLNLKILIF